jgi:rhamnogalacturonyl hydrolase YesR
MKRINSIPLVLIILLCFSACKSTQQKKETVSKIEASMLKALEWQEANPIFVKAPTDWTNGVYYLGVTQAHKSTKNKAYLDALKSMAVRNDWKPWNRFFHADDITICYSYTYLASIKSANVNLKPTSDVLQDHLFKDHPWKTGKEQGDAKTLWYWCDALFMAPPVITSYAKLKNNSEYLTAMDKYYKESYDLLYDKEEALFARDLRFKWEGLPTDKKSADGKKIFWSRGNGWVLAGLALVLEDLPKNYKNRDFYEDLFVKMAMKIKAIQPEDGLWRANLLSPGTDPHGEVSGSGLFTFAMAWGINNGLLSKDEYQPAVLKAWKALEGCQQENGKIGWVQNIGFDPRPANADSWQNFGTGAFLLAGSEVLKLNNQK